jgi:hypothetical protein
VTGCGNLDSLTQAHSVECAIGIIEGRSWRSRMKPVRFVEYVYSCSLSLHRPVLAVGASEPELAQGNPLTVVFTLFL